MADEHQLMLIKEGVGGWNKWRIENPNIVIDLSSANLAGAEFRQANLYEANFAGSDLMKADLSGSSLGHANFSGANLYEANFVGSDLMKADLSGSSLGNANFSGANLCEANFVGSYLFGARLMEANLMGACLIGAEAGGTKLSKANLSKAILSDARFGGSNFSQANLTGAFLRRSDFEGALFSQANLEGAVLSQANLTAANLSGADFTRSNLEYATLVLSIIEQAIFKSCQIFGISAWDVVGNPKEQSNLIITEDFEPTVTVDDLELAQFVYLLLNNKKVRNIIDTITSKVVLILGRFTDDRKAVLDAIRDELRKMNLTPILFDFDKPASKDVTGTVETLARMARFIIADLTDPSSIPHELASVVPHLRTTPVLPIRLQGAGGYSMFDHYSAYPWVLKRYDYVNIEELIATMPEVIAPANEKADKFRNSI